MVPDLCLFCSNQLCRVFLDVFNWFHDRLNAIIACLSLLVAVGTIIYQIVQSERAPDPSEIDVWIANNDYRQHCQHLHDNGKHSKNCDEALAKPLLPPPVASQRAVSQADELLPINQHLLARAPHSTEKDTSSSMHVAALVEPRFIKAVLHNSMAYLPQLLIITVLLYVVLCVFVKRRLSRNQWSPHNLSGHITPQERATQIVPLWISASEPYKLFFDQHQGTDYKTIDEGMTATDQVHAQELRWYTPKRDVTPRRRQRRPYKYPHMVYDTPTRSLRQGNPKDQKIDVSMERTIWDQDRLVTYECKGLY